MKSIAVVCSNPAEAKRLQDEYEYIGRATRREGNVLIVKPS